MFTRVLGVIFRLPICSRLQLIFTLRVLIPNCGALRHFVEIGTVSGAAWERDGGEAYGPGVRYYRATFIEIYHGRCIYSGGRNSAAAQSRWGSHSRCDATCNYTYLRNTESGGLMRPRRPRINLRLPTHLPFIVQLGYAVAEMVL